MKTLYFYLIVLLITPLYTSAQSLEWIQHFAASESEYVYATDIETDESGNIFIVGIFSGTVDFDPGVDNFDLTADELGSSFICKLDETGNFLWAIKYIPTIRIFLEGFDSVGSLYLSISFVETQDFNPGSGVFEISSEGSVDSAILKLSPSGEFIWAKSFGSTGQDYITGVSIDANDNSYITGIYTGEADFDPGPGSEILDNLGGSNYTFVLKLNAAGEFVWVKQFANEMSSWGNDIEIDDLGNIYLTGRFGGSMDFDLGPNEAILTSSETAYRFICKMDFDGNYIWATSSGCGNGILVGPNNAIYVTGNYENTIDIDPSSGVLNLTAQGGDNIYICKLNAITSDLIWGKSIGGPGEAFNPELTLDNSGNVLITGTFLETIDFNEDIDSLNSEGDRDIFVSQLDISTGNDICAFNIGGIGLEEPYGILSTSSGDILLSGLFQETVDFDLSEEVLELTSNANVGTFDADSFILKFAPCENNLGIEDNDDIPSLKVYPNPSSGQFILEINRKVEILKIEIYDSCGRLIKKDIHKFTNRIDINLTNYSSGLYFAKLTFENSDKNMKLVKL
ncbi:T9SS type A sorting domain-containing protein [Mariniflexile soesokkakense]|uniref:T9SS type A sorting domain-containing protein n=1 Tax=Mariniflexile soesokkakense TaxID=1343160 RepID=A0ABV0AG74_9FLAO